MLTGVQDFKIDVGVLADNPVELGDFDEVGAGADEDEIFFQISILNFFEFSYPYLPSITSLKKISYSFEIFSQV